jgi:pimeloyl-ACP methyl ester carboxylesterase
MQATHDAYCEFYQSAISSIGIRQPLVIAHSFGGFVFTQCAAQHPEMLSKLVLVSVPGIFPSNGGWDYLWYVVMLLLPFRCGH